MEALCVGLSHKTAPLEVRERFALQPEQELGLLGPLCAQLGAEALFLSTCNRAELYLLVPDAAAAVEPVKAVFASVGGAGAAGQLYEHRGSAALTHLFRVASSLDSMIVGEPQILGQVKDAYERAQQAGLAQKELHRLCQAAFAAAKRVRTETEIGRAQTSMASAAVALAEKIFGGLSQKTVLVIGAGEMAELAAKHLLGKGASRLLLTNRTAEKAVALAQTLGGQARPFEQLGALLGEADVVISSTAAPRPIIDQALVADAMRARRRRPLFLVDLAVPRDIAPEVHGLESVYAYDVDDIQRVVHENSHARAAEAEKAERVLAEELGRYLEGNAVRQNVPVLAQLRARAEQIARAEVERTLAQLPADLAPKHRKSIEAMAQAIVNKLLHQPTARLRAVGAESGENRLVGAAVELFGLEESEAPAVEQEGGAKAAQGAKR